MKKHSHLENGSPLVAKLGDPFYLCCCDCGLVHLVMLDEVSYKSATLKFYRDEYKTRLVRQENNKKKS